MEDFSFEAVAQKSIKGIFALVSRTFVIQILGVLTSLVLTIYLDPASFGVFFIVSSLIVFFNYFQDIGLAASLIQKKTNPTDDDFRTAFTVQQLMVFGISLPALFFSEQISHFYNLNQSGHFLFISLVVSFMLSSLRTIPTVILERSLDFKRLVIPQIAENFVYNISLILCAISGLGIASFTISVLLRGFVGLILTYIIQPWKIGFSFQMASLKTLLRFGIPFQVNSLLALIKDDLLTIYIGRVLPFSQVGYIGFSQRWAFLPLRLVMDNVIKITFPSFSRLQHDNQALKKGIEKSLFLTSSLIFPSAVGVILLSPSLIEHIPTYKKWEPALVSLAFFSLNTVLSSISTPLTNLLNAIGKVKITLYFMVFWTVSTWILTLFLINMYGYNGVALASFSVSLSSIAVFIVVRRYVVYSFFGPIVKQFIAALLMGIFIYATRGIVTSLPMLLVEIVISGSFYLFIFFILAKDELLFTVEFIIKSIRK